RRPAPRGSPARTDPPARSCWPLPGGAAAVSATGAAAGTGGRRIAGRGYPGAGPSHQRRETTHSAWRHGGTGEQNPPTGPPAALPRTARAAARAPGIAALAAHPLLRPGAGPPPAAGDFCHTGRRRTTLSA